MARRYDKYEDHGAFHWRLLDTDPVYRSKVEVILPHVRPEHRVLDIGCGDGAYLGLVAARCAGATGVDLEPAAVALANEKLRAAGLSNVTVFQGDVKDSLPRIKAGGYDVVYSMDVIEHMERPWALLETARRAVKGQGIFFLGTPLFAGKEHQSEYHAHEYSLAELERAAKSRFRVEAVIRVDHKARDKSIMKGRFVILKLRPRPGK